MEQIFSRQFFHCLICNQKKQIKTINILINNRLSNQNIISDKTTENSNYSNSSHKNRSRGNFAFESNNPIDKKFEFLENFANHLNRNLHANKIGSESIINNQNSAAFDNSINTNFEGISQINPNSSNKIPNLYNSTLVNETSPYLGVSSNNVSKTVNCLLNAFSPIKNKDPTQQRLFCSAMSQSNNI